jgi:hypothetical protein
MIPLAILSVVAVAFIVAVIFGSGVRLMNPEDDRNG